MFPVQPEKMEQLRVRPELGRALLDLGRAERRAGWDPRPSLEGARELLKDCGAEGFLGEVNVELATSE